MARSFKPAPPKPARSPLDPPPDQHCERCGAKKDTLFSHVSCPNRCDWKPPEKCPYCKSDKVKPFVSMWSTKQKHCLDCGRVWIP